MSASDETQTQLIELGATLRELDAFFKAAIKEQGFTATLRSLKKGRLPRSGMMTVLEGVAERQPSGLYTAALQTDQGPLVFRNAQRTDRESTDLQSMPSDGSLLANAEAGSILVTPDELLVHLADAGANVPSSLICAVELARFDAAQRKVLLPLLWQYILCHRDSAVRGELVAVGAAIRKYIANIPMDHMGQLATLLESGHRSALPVELEIEVAKMIYRNFEVHPPLIPDPQPQLAQRLWEMVQAYTNPRILSQGKHSAVASLSIQAIVAMRSPLAEQAWQTAIACPYRWFAELVSDSLDRLGERWSTKSSDAAAWLAALQKSIAVHV